MPFNKIVCIINPSSGKDEAILGAINNAVKESSAEWKVHVSLKEGDILKYVEQGLRDGCDLCIVYGGDGSVMEAARALYKTTVPLLVLPGGTANVISKELGLPQNTSDVLALLLKNQLTSKTIDMATVNDIPFLLRVNFGILADMIRKTNTQTKQNYGQLAYGITAASRLSNTTPSTYTLTLDTETLTFEAVGLMVTNMGSVGIGNLTLNQNISNNDGLLDIIVIQNIDLGSIFNLAASTLNQAALQGNIKHYQSKKITITATPERRVICDDEEKKFSEYVFTTEPSSLTVLIPQKI